jgi:hypothetical protein
MERKPDTMSPRKYRKHAGFLAAVAVGAAVLAPTGAAADGPACDVPLIVVNGSGEVRVHPDSLHVDVGVEARAQTLDQARNQANAGMEHVLAAVRALRLPDLGMETSVLQVSPVYAAITRENQAPRITGYSASNHVTVKIVRAPVDELGDRGSRILDAALGAGANSVSGIDFFLADPAPAEDEALGAAVHDAQRDAQTIAAAAGVTLGELRSVEETSGMRIMPRALRIEAVASTPIEVEDIVVQNSVTARYTFH